MAAAARFCIILALLSSAFIIVISTTITRIAYNESYTQHDIVLEYITAGILYGLLYLMLKVTNTDLEIILICTGFYIIMYLTVIVVDLVFENTHM
jgi:hypothetical protein